MTEKDLREIERKVEDGLRDQVPSAYVYRDDVRRLIAEIRRLRAIQIPGYNLTVADLDKPPEIRLLNRGNEGTLTIDAPKDLSQWTKF